jgi:hypothetical protein
LGAAVLEALGDQLAAAADAAYRDAADEQRSFAAAATSGAAGNYRAAFSIILVGNQIADLARPVKRAPSLNRPTTSTSSGYAVRHFPG